MKALWLPYYARRVDPSESLRQRGYAVFPGLYSRAFAERARNEILRLYDKAGRPRLTQEGKSTFDEVHGLRSGSGLMIGRMLHQAPELVDGYFHPELLRVFGENLGDNVRLDATGGCISDENRNPVLAWHNHVGGVDDHMNRPIDVETLDPTRIRRLVMLIYLDGLTEERGPLMIHPRKLDDDFRTCPSYDEHVLDRMGNDVITCEPGTSVLLEERTWHCAFGPSFVGFRCFLGAVVTAAWAVPSENSDPPLCVPPGVFRDGVFGNLV